MMFFSFLSLQFKRCRDKNQYPYEYISNKKKIIQNKNHCFYLFERFLGFHEVQHFCLFQNSIDDEYYINERAVVPIQY